MDRTRLIMPAGASAGGSTPPEREEAERKEPKIKNGGGGGGRRLHPFIQGLLDTIPDIPNPMEKPEWPIADRTKWLQTAANIFDLIYKGEGGIL